MYVYPLKMKPGNQENTKPVEDPFNEDEDTSEWDSDDDDIPWDKYEVPKGLKTTPFLEFVKVYTEKLYEEYPGVNANDEARCTIGTWKELDKKERHKYFELARKKNNMKPANLESTKHVEDPFNEDEDTSEWDSDDDDIPWDKYEVPKGLKTTPFLEFVKVYTEKLYEEYPGVNANDEARCTIGTWKELDKKERHKYFELARKKNNMKPANLESTKHVEDPFNEDEDTSEWDSDDDDIPWDKYEVPKGLKTTPFLEFVKVYTEKLYEEYPGVNANDEARCTIGTWKELDKKERHKYFELARKKNGIK
ncbi:hypothetical protein TVAG_238580 [Trichomonas vaginalis G3]|uniref:Uncharacterized protein n=1 Tax=Trichomonas vaginalis (strain ATCC PRA-98 / G3) TaxID=412133 RepID=A2DG90_TRIV3|nr:HMG-box family [Trichomonas vaginalis G3]EAY20486.1 hypothetical protein TVAG_238580 [Trichomonas vaginalis G3]KAI5488345.1 HMG-box family [Trichomonas vaginalis G3]|eukprot:XP_001581472.1 hypothetical protein [Trichomonas vaginalis G3]